MKKSTILICCLLPIFAIGQNGFTVKLNLKGLGDHKVKVAYQKNGKTVVDTLSKESENLIVWKGKLNEPQLVRMDVLDTSLYVRMGKAIMAPPTLQFLLTNSDISIHGDAKEIFTSTIKSKDPEVTNYEKLRTKDLPIAVEIWRLQKEQNRKMKMADTAGNYQISQQISVLRKKNQALRAQFVDDNPKSFSSILILQSLFLILPVDEMSNKYGNIDDKYKDSDAAKILLAKIESNKKTANGKPVIPFAQEGIDGKMVDIAALKGKVVLIDFWGSWCVPCRKSHPALKELYEKYNAMGFEIIGIANEAVVPGKSKKDQEVSWRKAVKEDGINWLQIISNPDVRDIPKEFDIVGYPTKYLVDQDGKFIMKIIGNSEAVHKSLEDKLAQLFSK